MKLFNKKMMMGILAAAFIASGAMGGVSFASSYHDNGQYHNNPRHEQGHLNYHYE